MAKYNQRMKEAGVTGVFYAALGMARTGYFTPEEWNEFCKPYDLIAMESIRDLPNLVHTCGIYGNPRALCGLPLSGHPLGRQRPGQPAHAGQQRMAGWQDPHGRLR